ncbi:MAG: 2-oxo-4-hydroxy-4-carboxy-5-ureidoimidazoline decarboxylase [Betaproteobacteria bacterium]
MTLARINALDRAAFVAALGGVFEHSPWIADATWDRRPFAGVDALHAAMVAVMREGGEAKQLALLCAHPELAGKAMVRRELTAESTGEQTGAGLAQCSPEEFARLTDFNARYHAKFGFPFILAVKGLDRAGILREFARRVENDRAAEFAECLGQVAKIARFRLDALVAG